MKKVICTLCLVFASVSSALATTYPLTIENCGYKETFTKPPERVVALGQNTAEILLLLGLQDKVIASAFWPTKVLPQLAEQNAKIKTLTVEIPTLNPCWRKTRTSFLPRRRCCWDPRARWQNAKI